MANKKSKENSQCNVYGAVPGVEVGTVFASRKEFYQIHNSATPISIGPEGPYSILVLRSQNLTDYGCVFGFCTGESQKYREDSDAEPEGEFNKNLVLSVKSCLPVRILRAASLKNCYAPVGGFRYDGLYFCKGYQTEVIKNKLVFKFKMFRLEKQAPAPWETINQNSTAHLSSDLEITHERYSTDASTAEKNAYDFQVNIQEYFHIKKEEPFDHYSSENEVDAPSSSGLVPYNHNDLVDSGLIMGLPDRKPLILASGQVYEVSSDLDNDSVSELLAASGLISKEIHFPKSSIKIDMDMENDGIIVSQQSLPSDNDDDDENEVASDDEVASGTSSQEEFHKPYQMDVEIDEKPLSYKYMQQYISENRLFLSNRVTRAIALLNSVSITEINDDEDDENTLVASPTNAISLKSEPINDVEIIVPSPHESDSPQGFNSIIKVDNSPSPENSDRIEIINCNENQSTILSDVNYVLPTITSYMTKTPDNEVEMFENSNCVIKQSYSPCCIDSSSDYDATEVVPTESYLVDPFDNTEITEESDLILGQSQRVKTTIANDRSNNDELCSEPIALDGNEPAQIFGTIPGIGLEYASHLEWWSEKKSEIEFNFLQAIGDSKHFVEKLAPLVEKIEKCQCAPAPNIVQSLLGSLGQMFYLYFSHFFCECTPKASRKKQDNGFKCFNNILTKLDQHDARRLKAIFAFLVLRTCNPEEVNEGYALMKNDKTYSALMQPSRKSKILNNTVLTSDDGDKFDLAESVEGKFYLIKRSDNLSKSIPSSLEFNDIHTGKDAGNIIQYDNEFWFAKSPRPRKVTRIASKRIATSEPAMLTRKRGRLKKTKSSLAIESPQSTPHHQNVLLPSLAVPQPHLLGFTGYDVRRSENYRNDFEDIMSSYIHYPPKPLDFRGFNNYDIMRGRISEELFSHLLTNQSYVYNNVKKKRRKVNV